MRSRFLAPSVFALAAVALAASAASSLPASAQQDGFGLSEMEKRSARPEGVALESWKENLLPSGCPDNPYELAAEYPQNLDDGGPVDKAVKARAEALFGKAKEKARNYLETVNPCAAPKGSLYTRISAAPFKASPKAFSVLFGSDEFQGGAHGEYSYASVNLAADGGELTLDELFADPKKSSPLLWGLMYRGYCSAKADRKYMPYFFKDVACGRHNPPGAPRQMSRPKAGLDAAGHMTLNSLGLTVHLSADEGYARYEGFQLLDITKEELIGIGADPELWK
ncbi:MAG: hypothetical protein LBQ12_02700 [Deltaproteobacteria bacterium]|jgi:hypothetical protein|nr:hypothetical protein [Deltaproteobacteria bacterium]